ncbi:MAG: glycosyltransferase [Acidobacteriaceae bacterium]
MARILHLIGSDSLGGPEKQLLHHARDARDADYEVVLGSFQDDAEPPELLGVANRYGVETVSVPGGIRPGLVDDLTRYLRTGEIDLLCTHGYKANVVGHFAAKHADVPWVPFVQNFTAESWQVTLYERLERSILVRSPWVVCGSPAQARELGRVRRGRRAPLVIQNAVLAPREAGLPQIPVPTREELGFRRRALVFGTAARFTREKGHRVLLDAFAMLNQMLPDQPMEMLLLGEGSEEQALRVQARRLGIEPQVCFAGSPQRTAAWMKAMDCLVQPSPTDGATSSVMEAMLMGIPVIATDTGGISDVIQKGETGLLVEPDSPVELAEAMKKMACSSSLRGRLATEAKYRVQRDFSPIRQRELLEMLYKSMIGDSFPIEVEQSAHVVA